MFAILSGVTSYRKVQAFIVERYETLDELFELNWKRLPAYTTIRDIIQRTETEELERSFREHAFSLIDSKKDRQFIACDGKVLKGSFDHFEDQKAIQILSAFASDSKIILAHEEIATKTNEIPTARYLMKQLGLTGCVFTLDALHCQKNATSC